MSPNSDGFLGSAKSRLLPASIPFRFFGAALVFHAVFWALLLAGAADLPEFAGGPGWILGSVHALTLGVFTMTAMGASLQLLPVATLQPFKHVILIRVLWWLFAPGTAALVWGMALGVYSLMAAGSLAVGVSLALYAWLLAGNLLRAKSMPMVVAHVWMALAGLLGLAALGLMLIFNLDLALLDDPLAAVAAHITLAAFGFMGLLALGFSYVLVPMFCFSPAPSNASGYASLALAVTAILAALTGIESGAFWPMILAGGLGLGAVGLHLLLMHRVVAARMRKKLDRSLQLIRVSWLFLPLSVLIGAAWGAELLPPVAAAWFGVMLLPGWLLTFLLGTLQRIAPFLASMHASRRKGRAPLLSALTPERPLAVHFYCHWAALLLLVAGLAGGLVPVIQLGAAIGLAGSIAFLWFLAGVLRRTFAVPSQEDAA